MCGIVGYLGGRHAVPVLIEGLKKLEYRGYDSSGIAVLNDLKLNVVKSRGKLINLEGKLSSSPLSGNIGIGHTRWATHGRPSDANAHPHTDCSGKLAVVHNGIIENYQKLKGRLEKDGHRFLSETDTEVIAHLIESCYDGDLVRAVARAVSELEGSYAVLVVSEEEPDKLVAVRQDSPLIIGLGDGENLVASDIPALLNYTRKTLILENGEMAVVKAGNVDVYNINEGKSVDKEIFEVEWDAVAAEKEGYPHFMLKEIYEQPKALRETLAGRITADGEINLEEVFFSTEEVKKFSRIYITACGTAYHAGLIGKYIIEKLARIPVEVDIASEFRYKDPILDERTLAIAISQSGETADTLAALRVCHEKGARVLAVTNVVGSSVSREADDVIYTWAGPEIAVASTKAYVTQLESMYLLGVYLGRVRGTLSQEEGRELVSSLQNVSDVACRILEQADTVKDWASRMVRSSNAFFVGRGIDYALAREGALKLKEISYIHAEAYAAGELKHGTLALIEEGVPVVALATQPALYEKMISNIKEIKARGADVTVVTYENSEEVANTGDRAIFLPRIQPLIAPIPAVIPLQLLAYYAAVARGCDVDQPRNLAKSVTVE